MRYVWFNGTLEQSGGGERLSLEVVRCLRELGHDAHLVVYFYDSKATFDSQYDYLEPIAMGEDIRRVRNPLSKIIARFRRLLWLRKTILQCKPDCVITSGTWNQVVDVYLSRLGTSIPYITHVFGSMFAFTPDKESLKFGRVFQKNFLQVRNSMKSYQEVVPESAPPMNLLRRLLLNYRATIKYHAVRASKALFVLSERNRWENQMLYGRDSIVLQGAFPARIFDYRPQRSLKQDLGLKGQKVILSIGRLAANKRVDLAIRAFAEIAHQRADVCLVIGGTGPEGDRLKVLTQELGLTNQVHFVGYVPESILWDYLADCDAFLHLDLADFDIAPLEALAMGANVVWGDEMDLPDLTRQLTCLWPVAPEPSVIAQTTIKSLEAGNRIMDRSARRQILEPYNWESYTARMTHAIDEAV